MMEQEKKALILLTETETDYAAGGAGNGNAFGHIETPAWSVNDGKATEAPGHNKII